MASSTTSSGQTYSGTVTSGNTQIIASGGTANYATISGGQMVISNGGNFSHTRIEAGGIATLYGGNGSYASGGHGGQAGGNTVTSGGTMIVGSGGASSGDKAISGGILSFGSGANNTYGSETAASGGTIIMGAGSFTGSTSGFTVASNGGVVLFQSGSKIDGSKPSIASSGGRIVWSSGSVISGNGAVISSGGTLDLVNGAQFGSGSITICSGGIIDFNAGSAAQDLSNVSAVYNSGVINLYSAGKLMAYVSATFSGVTVSNGQVFKPQRDTYDNGAAIVVCYLGGTLIEMADGTKLPVEGIEINDTVKTFVDGIETPDTVTWVGSQKQTVNPSLPDDQAGYPIRILRNALENGVPNKDLLVTSEHCLYLNGAFVPARMLVNNTSIYYDKTFTTYYYYHIETEKHAIIRADGVLAETYLDTGNKHSFSQHGKISVLISNRQQNWQEHAAAPLRTDRAFVEPLSRRFATLAGADLSPPPVNHDHNLHLTLSDGRLIKPMYEKNGHLKFLIPGNTTSVILNSNTSRPCDTTGPFVDDRRTLGVLVGKIHIWGTEKAIDVQTHLTTGLEGWSSQESTLYRWTTGHALLPLPPMRGEAVLSLEIHAAGPYLTAAEPARLKYAS